MKIITHYDPKPIPIRRFDWCAYDDSTFGGDPRDPVGWGETEQEAIDDLNGQIKEERTSIHDASHGTYFPSPCLECQKLGWLDE